MAKTEIETTTTTKWKMQVAGGYGEAPYGHPHRDHTDAEVSNGYSSEKDRYTVNAYSVSTAGLREMGEWLLELADDLTPCPEKTDRKKRRGRR